MADLQITCPACSTVNLFSEYSEPTARACRKCGKTLETVATEPVPGAPVAPQGDLKFQVAPKKAQAGASDVPTAGRSTPVYNSKKIRGSSEALGFLVFLVLSVLLIAPQAGYLPEAMPYYLLARYGVVAVAFLLVVAEAFRFSAFAGFFSLLIPPYTIFYAGTRLESHWRKGVFFAMVAMVAAELFFIPSQSLLNEAGDWANRRIDAVSKSIQRVGDAPID